MKDFLYLFHPDCISISLTNGMECQLVSFGNHPVCLITKPSVNFQLSCFGYFNLNNNFIILLNENNYTIWKNI